MLVPEALALSQTIDRHPLTVTQDTPVSQVVTLMSQARASCVLVIEGQQLVGIFTERDVVKLTAAGISLAGLEIAGVMTQQAIALTEEKANNILSVLSLLRQHRIRHLPIVNSSNELVGLITHQSIREILQPADLLKLRRVAEVMTTKIVQASMTASVFSLTQLMATQNVSCVVIVDSENQQNPRPVGIVTERDIVQLQAMGVNFTSNLAQTVMSSPLLPTQPNESLWIAHQQMRQHHIRRLVVIGDMGELVGIVTQSSLLCVLDPIEMLTALDALQQVVEARTKDLKIANDQLQNEIIERQRAEEKLTELASKLQNANDELEIQVEKRTTELRTTLEQLQKEIIQRQEAEEEVSKALEKEKELSELKTRFISMASHEFRTPLAKILTSSDLIKNFGARFSEEKKLQYLNKIQTAVKEMTLLLEDVLLIGKTSSGRIDFLPVPINLQVFCRDVLEDIRLTSGEKYTFVMGFQGDCSSVEIDEKLIRQMLTNLLSNAVKYSPKGGTVEFNLSCENGQAVFKVRDEGIGIPKSDKERLFEIFHRGSNVGTIPGTGLGTAIIKNAVEAHGGAIALDSVMGVGTTFTVSIPTSQLRGQIRCCSPQTIEENFIPPFIPQEILPGTETDELYPVELSY